MSLADTASKLLAKNGEPVTIQFPGTPGFDPITGDPTTAVPGQTIACKGYPSRYKSSEIDGSTIISGDVRLIMELVTPRPTVNSTATVDAKTYRIMDLQPIRKSGADVVYIAQLRAN